MTAIDDVFTRLALVYGQRFTCHWPESAIPAVKAAWETELRGISHEAIDFALANLPAGNPPMALDFRDLCRRYQEDAQARVPIVRQRQTEEEKARALAILKSFKRPDPQGPKAWAWRMRARELAGERLTLFQRQCWREALRAELAAESHSPD